jgi:hypothetical protein
MPTMQLYCMLHYFDMPQAGLAIPSQPQPAGILPLTSITLLSVTRKFFIFCNTEIHYGVILCIYKWLWVQGVRPAARTPTESNRKDAGK